MISISIYIRIDKMEFAVSNPPLSPDQKNEKPVALKEIDVATLVGGSREAILVHRGERYRLRITANGKLILTK